MWSNLALLASVVVLVLGKKYLSDFDTIDSIYDEQPCMQAGGVCVVAADCPRGLRTRSSGLCPQQQAKGVDCCHGVSIRETRCKKNGGSCIPRTFQCPENLLISRATDCPGEKCCVNV